MRKTLLIVVLLVSTHQLFAFCTQGSWRWRKDDGSETSANWIADQNTIPTISSGSENIRLRIEYYNDQTQIGDSSGLGTSVLEYSVLGSGVWDSITTTSTTKDFMLAASPNVVDSQLTTNQLIVQSGYTFEGGRIVVSSDELKQQFVHSQYTTEYEWVIKPTENIKPNTTYIFNLWVLGGAYDTTVGISRPTLITAAVLPIHLADFKVQPDNNRVKVMWTTASELNNDHFAVERSVDAINWKTVATIKGNGTSSIAHNYNALDVNPVKGMNYYRIKQYDLNGKSFISDVRSLKMFIDNSQLTVYPNPAKAVINFILRDYTGNNVVATLTNNSGRLIHQENIKEVQANVKYTLSMKQQPAPGIYILQLKGEGLSESIRVIVQ